MKTTNTLNINIALCALLIFTGCVYDDDFQVPDVTVIAPVLDGDVITIAALASLFEQAVLARANELGYNDPGAPGYEQAIAVLRTTERLDLSENTLYIEGYVISSDASGNWFEEIIIQDKPENPTAGVRLLIDESPLFTTYEFGRKLYVRLGGFQSDADQNSFPLPGLFLGDSNGVLTLGVTDNLEKIPAPLQFDFIIRGTEVATIIPSQTTIANFSNAVENTFIELMDMQFIKGEVIDSNLTFAGEPLDEFDGERTLISCDTNQTLILSTSTFANFKSALLPAGRGSIRGVLSRNFFGETYNLVINDLTAITFQEVERCDPVEIDCGLAASAGSIVLFEDDFEDQNNNQPISGNGWTNYIEAGSEAWEAYSQSSGSVSIGVSARVGSFNSGDNLSIAWLVTPQLDLTITANPTVEFLTSTSFADGSTLEILFSADWDGTPENIPLATWDVLAAANVAANDDDFIAFFESGIVDLSCIPTSGYIAFKYQGSGNADFDGTYELEGVVVRGD